MKTMICKETKEEFYGIVIGTIGKHTTKYNETVDRWLFRTKCDGHIVEWECLGDYWELIDTDLRKVVKALDAKESEDSNVISTVLKILRNGWCKK